MKDCNQLGKDTDRDFGRRHGANVEADRRVHAGEALGRQAFVLQRVEDAGDFCAASDQAQVAEVAGRQRAERVEIMGVSAGDDHDVGRRGQAEGLVFCLDSQLCACLTEAFGLLNV